MRLLLTIFGTFVAWPVGLVHSHRAKRRLRGYAGAQASRLTLERVA